jgi:hypothetical protein
MKIYHGFLGILAMSLVPAVCHAEHKIPYKPPFHITCGRLSEKERVSMEEQVLKEASRTHVSFGTLSLVCEEKGAKATWKHDETLSENVHVPATTQNSILIEKSIAAFHAMFKAYQKDCPHGCKENTNPANSGNKSPATAPSSTPEKTPPTSQNKKKKLVSSPVSYRSKQRKGHLVWELGTRTEIWDKLEGTLGPTLGIAWAHPRWSLGLRADYLWGLDGHSELDFRTLKFGPTLSFHRQQNGQARLRFSAGYQAIFFQQQASAESHVLSSFYGELAIGYAFVMEGWNLVVSPTASVFLPRNEMPDQGTEQTFFPWFVYGVSVILELPR